MCLWLGALLLSCAPLPSRYVCGKELGNTARRAENAAVLHAVLHLGPKLLNANSDFLILALMVFLVHERERHRTGQEQHGGARSEEEKEQQNHQGDDALVH